MWLTLSKKTDYRVMILTWLDDVVTNVCKTTRFFYLLKSLFWGVLCFIGFQARAWETLSPGIDYIDKKNFLAPWSHLHIFRVDLSKNQLILSEARDIGKIQAFVSDIAPQYHALLAINGGFFDKNFHTLGLRISQNQLKGKLKSISWWAVFFIKDNQAYIKKTAQVTPLLNQISFAIQSGPRLIVDGKIPSLKAGRDERTAMGITKDGKVIIAVTENTPMTTTELAEILLDKPIYARNALNLDGGSSTQLYTNFHSLNLDLHGFAMVADAILVKPSN